ncbi:hypothetical protein EIP91_003299 [Steccherinum ochraceum]|uniref:t-SNARE coiled-coil homology domain-containing protein n=1 Tax=Steccherinum ochraceum TaxID=92696 RepID=A0A4R0RAV6_9APHY|nr:hypothetical protein EIP91_003299 [Steccherinum ochraceum]
MPVQTQEQIVHDRINLGRLVKSLEGLVAGEEWQESGSQTWIGVQAALHKMQYARKLLYKVELTTLESSSNPTSRFDDVRSSLDRLEAVFRDVEKRVSSKRFRPEALLPTLPTPEPPTPPTPKATLPLLDVDTAPRETLLSSGLAVPNTAFSTHDLLLSPSDAVPDSAYPHHHDRPPAALPSKTRRSTSSQPAPLAPTSSILQNSRAIQDELSSHLAHMASQLRRNALHFSHALETDKAVVQDAQAKLERNYGVMRRERGRLGEHHARSWGMAGVWVVSVLVVVVGFLLAFFVIRVT